MAAIFDVVELIGNVDGAKAETALVAYCMDVVAVGNVPNWLNDEDSGMEGDRPYAPILYNFVSWSLVNGIFGCCVDAVAFKLPA